MSVKYKCRPMQVPLYNDQWTDGALKPQSHRAYDQVTTYLRLQMLESWANSRKNIRLVAEVVILVAEVVGDRKGKISRSKVDGHVQNF